MREFLIEFLEMWNPLRCNFTIVQVQMDDRSDATDTHP